jgi:hypothetical protein
LPSQGVLTTRSDNSDYYPGTNQGFYPIEISISADFLSSKKGLNKRHIENSSKQIEFGIKNSMVFRGGN